MGMKEYFEGDGDGEVNYKKKNGFKVPGGGVLILACAIGSTGYGIMGWVGAVVGFLAVFVFFGWLSGDIDFSEEKTPEQIAKEKEEKRRKEEGFYPKQKQ